MTSSPNTADTMDARVEALYNALLGLGWPLAERDKSTLRQALTASDAIALAPHPQFFAMDYTGCIHSFGSEDDAIKAAQQFAETANGGTPTLTRSALLVAQAPQHHFADAGKIADLRHACALSGPCSVNGDGCSCSPEVLASRTQAPQQPVAWTSIDELAKLHSGAEYQTLSTTVFSSPVKDAGADQPLYASPPREEDVQRHVAELEAEVVLLTEKLATAKFGIEALESDLSVADAERERLRQALTMPDAERRLWFISDSLGKNGHINRSDICEAFHISVPQASADLARWQALHPGAVTYNKSRKQYETALIQSQPLQEER